MVWKRVGCCRVKRWPSVATWEGWRHWRGEGCASRVMTGQWSTTPRNPSPRHPSCHPARVHRQCWIIQCELRAFVLFLELFVLIGNRLIIGRLFGTDYRPTDNRPVRYRCIPNFEDYNMLKVYSVKYRPHVNMHCTAVHCNCCLVTAAAIWPSTWTNTALNLTADHSSWFVCLFLYLSICPSVSVAICLFICLCTCQSLSLFQTFGIFTVFAHSAFWTSIHNLWHAIS